MKRSTILHAVGGAIIIGIAAYGVYKVLQKQKTIDSNSTNTTKNDNKNLETYVSPSYTSESKQSFSEAKQSAASSIYNRHREASQIVSESLHNILKGEKNADIIITKNSDELSHMSSDLDDLLK